MDNTFHITELSCNSVQNPIGIDREVYFSWKLKCRGEFPEPAAYRVVVADSMTHLNNHFHNLWDSGVLNKNIRLPIKYGGKALESRQRVYWRVFVWDMEGRLHESTISWFEMGLLGHTDWIAKWICHSHEISNDAHCLPAPLFRKTFDVCAGLEKATLYLCGLGYQDAYINGNEISNEVLSPGFTAYDKTVLYSTYDITAQLAEGKNVMGVMLGNGFYNSFTKDVWDFSHAAWRHHPKMIAQIHLYYQDGTQDIIASDSTWKCANGPVIFNAVRNGEFYDARLEVEGWNCQEYDDHHWSHVKIAKAPGGSLRAASCNPIRITGTLPAKSVRKIGEGQYIVDFGENISGWVKLQVHGERGSEIRIRYGEELDSQGHLDVSCINLYVLSGEFQTDTYILKGKGTEIWHPRFTYHGFRYVEITSPYVEMTEDMLTACIVHTDFHNTGTFECSNVLLNSIQTMSRKSLLYNFHSIPTDCPHREKNGWTGDMLLSAEQMLYNFDGAANLWKWLGDFKDAQRASGQLPGIIPTPGWGYHWGSGPAWDSAIIIIPWNMYLYHGDEAILEYMYENMKRYMDFMESMSEGYILSFGLGDWCPPQYVNGLPQCPVEVTDTAYFYSNARIMKKVSGILGKAEEEKYYNTLADEIQTTFIAKFINISTGEVSTPCQTSQACALYHGLAEGALGEKVFAKLVSCVMEKECFIDCGILGTKYILNVLSQFGRTDLAYRMVTKTECPSWGYWIEQGATTLWETWGQTPTTSKNHHMFSCISEWFYKYLAGIQYDELQPGFKHIVICPQVVSDLHFVRAEYETRYGKVRSEWKWEKGTFRLEVEIPMGCTATVHLPKTDLQHRTYEVGTEIHCFETALSFT